MTALWAIIGCGALSIVYGIWAIQSVMSADAGTQQMQEIAAAIAEGAQAYLKRQYMTIAIVGVVVLIAPLVPARQPDRDRLPDRRDAVGRRGLHRHERLGAGERAHRAGRHQVARRGPRYLVQGRRRDRHAGRRPRAARCCDLLRNPDRPARPHAGEPHRHRRAGRALFRRLADLDLRPSRRRHLHQGR